MRKNEKKKHFLFHNLLVNEVGNVERNLQAILEKVIFFSSLLLL